jgi:hypothetical protein
MDDGTPAHGARGVASCPTARARALLNTELMQIEQPHVLGETTAISLIDRFLDDLMRMQPPGGVTIKDARKQWDGNRMNFSFAAGKGFLKTTIRGVMEVTADRVVLTSELPALVRAVLGEDKIREVIARELARILGNGRSHG